MKKLKIFFNIRNLYMFFLVYFFLGYFKNTQLREKDIYIYITQYLGSYEKILWIFLCGDLFSMFMANKKKKVVFEVRLYFFVILSIVTGYFYLLEDMRKLGFPSFGEARDLIMKIGLIKMNLGYIEIYTFLKLYKNIEPQILYGALCGIIFISIIILVGKLIRWFISSIINFFIRKSIERKKRKKEKLEREAKEKQERYEREIYDAISDMKKKYAEKNENKVEEIGENI